MASIPAHRILGTLTALGLTLSLAGCIAGDGSSLDDGGRSLVHPYAPSLGSAYGAVRFAPTYRDVSEVFFASFCTGCHGGAAPAKGLDLTAAAAYEALVGVASQGRPNLSLVEPDNPADSYLVRKLEGGPMITGRQMPRGRPARQQTEIDTVREWIASGAPRN